MYVKLFLFGLVLFSADIYAQTCAIAPAPAEAACAGRTPFAFGNPGDFVIAYRANASTKCVTIGIDNFLDAGAGKLSHWFSTNVKFPNDGPGGKETVPVLSINAWTNVSFYLHRGNCNAIPILLKTERLLPSSAGPIGRGSYYQGGGRGIKNRP